MSGRRAILTKPWVKLNQEIDATQNRGRRGLVGAYICIENFEVTDWLATFPAPYIGSLPRDWLLVCSYRYLPI